MITIDELRQIALFQHNLEEQRAAGQKRLFNFNERILESHIMDITGVRRGGKSTLLTQLIRQHDTNWFYLNFESPQLAGLALDDSPRLDAVISETGSRRLFFDEIDQLDGWERYVRQKLDEGYQIFISGSNASLLEGELSTKLTGRHYSRELFPFEYKEYLNFTGMAPGLESTRSYMTDGGFPRHLQLREPILLQELFDDIVYRDVILHNGARETDAIIKLASYLVENIGSRFSASKLLTSLNISSASTISQWCSWMENAYLFFFIPIFSDSVKVQLRNPKKFYCIDTGLEYAVSTRRIPNDDARFENMVFLALRRLHKDITYYNDGNECDFIVSDRHSVKAAFQASIQINRYDMEREFLGLRNAMKKFDLKEGFVITANQSDDFKTDEGMIHLVPFAVFAGAN